MKKSTLFIITLLALIGTSCTTAPLDLKVMSFNIRYDNPADSLHNWNLRKEQAFAMLKEQDCDLIGTQEVLANQLTDLKGALTNYDYVGVGREDGISKGEFSALFFKKNRFKLVDKGNFMLSETPDVMGSKGWDGACERIASWALLQDKTTEKTLFFINTHLDHVGVKARKEGINLVLTKAHELAKNSPIILTGDFNAAPESDVIKQVVNPEAKNHLIDTRTAAVELFGTPWTYHNFDRLPIEQREIIDYIFVSPNTKTTRYEVLPMAFDNTIISDHTPIVANITLK